MRFSSMLAQFDQETFDAGGAVFRGDQ